MDSSTSKNTQTRLNSYKHHGKDPDELRRRRNQYNVSLRKVITKIENRRKDKNQFFFRINVRNKFKLNVIFVRRRVCQMHLKMVENQIDY